MTLPEAYESKVAEYSESLKFKQLPLLSWDVHMQNLKQVVGYRQDLEYIKSLSQKMTTVPNILKEFNVNGAVIVITDKNLNIEFASNNMIAMSGYQPQEVVGNTPKMFQGPKTDKNISKQIRGFVNKEESFEYVLTNYKKDKATYNCHIKGYPVFDKKGILVKYVAIEKVA